MRLKWIEDSSHGWLEVDTADIIKIGVVDKISECSYLSKDGTRSYLEEDCDASIFLNAVGYGSVFNAPIDVDYHDGRSWVRDCPSFQPNWINDNKIYLLKK